MGFNPKKNNQEPEQKVVRAPLPKGREVIGIIDQRLGGNKMMVAGVDGKTRNCRVPGRLKSRCFVKV